MPRHSSGVKASRKARARAARRRREQVEVERSSPRARAAARYWAMAERGVEAAGSDERANGGRSAPWTRAYARTRRIDSPPTSSELCAGDA